VTQALNEHRKPVAGSKVLVLGVSYKSDVGDLRESPALRLIELLHARGAEILYHDPHVPTLRTGSLDLRSVELTDAALQDADIVCVVTAHRAVDHERVARLAPLVMDFRNVVPRIGGKVVTL
jgi:UDP-N-acetyl-D-glucosamine dehydrogenase